MQTLINGLSPTGIVISQMPRPRIPARNDLKNTPLVFVGMVAVAVAVSFLYLIAWLVA
jgi:hypothetical protein